MYEEDIDFVLKRYKDLFGFDLSYMAFKVDSQPVYTNGEPCHEYAEDEKSGFYKIDAHDNVVADCGNPIGKIGLSFYDDIKALGIGSFEIFPEYRRLGHGEAVLKKLVSKYRNKYDLIYCFVDADNAPALALYNKIG